MLLRFISYFYIFQFDNDIIKFLNFNQLRPPVFNNSCFVTFRHKTEILNQFDKLIKKITVSYLIIIVFYIYFTATFLFTSADLSSYLNYF